MGRYLHNNTVLHGSCSIWPPSDAVVEKLMVGVSPNLYWSCQRNKIEWKRLRRDQIGMRNPRAGVHWVRAHLKRGVRINKFAL